MLLTIIGGPWNRMKVERGKLCGHVLRMIERPQTSFAAPFGEVPDMISYTEYYYTLRTIETPDGNLEYLAPEQWSEFEALNYLLNGKLPR